MYPLGKRSRQCNAIATNRKKGFGPGAGFPFATPKEVKLGRGEQKKSRIDLSKRYSFPIVLLPLSLVHNSHRKRNKD